MRRYSGVLVAAGMLLFAVIFFGVLIVIALRQIGDEDDTPDTPGGCEFHTVTEPALLYDRYDAGAPDASSALPTGQTYPVTRLSAQRVRILIDVDAGKTGWVDRASGELSGACESVPFQGVN